MLVTGIKSKPVYAPLRADIRGRYHLMLGLGVGADPLLRVLAEIQAEAAPLLKNTRVLYVPDGGDTGHAGAAVGRSSAAAAHCVERFTAAAIAGVRTFDSTPALLE